jgi:hypothetical protein
MTSFALAWTRRVVRRRWPVLVALALLVALVLTASVLSRFVSGSAEELLRLRATGLAAAGAAGAAVLAPLLAAALGVVVGAAGAVFVSDRLRTADVLRAE